MDEGTDAKDIFENKLLPLRRGEDYAHTYRNMHLLGFNLTPGMTLCVRVRVCRLHRCGEPQSERH